MMLDVTFKNYLKKDIEQSIEEAKQIIDLCKKVKGELIFIWHNSSFSALKIGHHGPRYMIT